MNTDAPALHVVFSMSAAKDLRDALCKVGRMDEVAAFPDNLSYGPIDPPNTEIREKWREEELQLVYAVPLSPLLEGFWTTALQSSLRRIAWVSRQSASDYCAFLEWLWRVGEGEIETVDLTDVRLINCRGVLIPPRPPGLIPSDTILRNALWDLARPITSLERKHYRDLWQRLRADNAPLRVLTDGELASAPISYFDPLLISCTTMEWRKAMRTVGDALGKFLDDGCFNTSDAVLSARIKALVQAGALELRGDSIELRKAEVRLAPPRDANQ